MYRINARVSVRHRGEFIEGVVVRHVRHATKNGLGFTTWLVVATDDGEFTVPPASVRAAESAGVATAGAPVRDIHRARFDAAKERGVVTAWL